MPSLPEPNRHSPLLLLMLALCALSLTAHINLAFLEGIHEARVLETAREMMELHNWVVPHFTGELRLEKPPLPYWGSALAFTLAGEPSVMAARAAHATGEKLPSEPTPPAPEAMLPPEPAEPELSPGPPWPFPPPGR